MRRPLQQSFPVARAKRGRGKARAFTDNHYRESGPHRVPKAFDFIKTGLSQNDWEKIILKQPRFLYSLETGCCKKTFCNSPFFLYFK